MECFAVFFSCFLVVVQHESIRNPFSFGSFRIRTFSFLRVIMPELPRLGAVVPPHWDEKLIPSILLLLDQTLQPALTG